MFTYLILKIIIIKMYFQIIIFFILFFNISQLKILNLNIKTIIISIKLL